MFLFLLNGQIFGFWGNKVGDIFVENTIKNLELDGSKVKLLHFFSLKDVPEFFEVSGNNLVIKKKVENVLPDGTVEESFETDKTLSGEVFFENGFFVKPC